MLYICWTAIWYKYIHIFEYFLLWIFVRIIFVSFFYEYIRIFIHIVFFDSNMFRYSLVLCFRYEYIRIFYKFHIRHTMKGTLVGKKYTTVVVAVVTNIWIVTIITTMQWWRPFLWWWCRQAARTTWSIAAHCNSAPQHFGQKKVCAM